MPQQEPNMIIHYYHIWFLLLQRSKGLTKDKRVGVENANNVVDEEVDREMSLLNYFFIFYFLGFLCENFFFQIIIIII